MTNETVPSNLFPAIGEVVDETAHADTTQATEEQEEEGPVQEIESLCMKCYEQVCQFAHSEG